MAHILEKYFKNTIRGKLSRYLILLLGTASLIFILLLSFNSVLVQRYNQNMQRILCLNEFYIHLDYTYASLKDYTKYGNETSYEKLWEENKLLQKRLDELNSMEINSIFFRDMQDIQSMVTYYQDKIEEIHGKFIYSKEEYYLPDTQRAVSRLFEEASDIYTAIGWQYKDLHVTLINEANKIQMNLNEKVKCVYILLLFLLGICVFLFIFYGVNMAVMISQPLRTLTYAAENVIHGELEQFQVIAIAQPGYEEVATLVSAFNLMLSQLKGHIQMMEESAEKTRALHEKEKENMKITTLLKESELKTLQLQVNPHFLFNTLTMIAQTAYLGDTDLTVELLHRTAQLLRYNLDYSGRSVSLAYEIEMLGNYIYIQEQRFGERIEFDFILDERFHQIEIPSFILQPLVENSIIHGIGTYSTNGKIVVQTEYHEKSRTGIISIIDNGLGMSEQVRQQVLQKLDSDKEQLDKIGIANVYKRLKYFFSEHCKMNIYSSHDTGTEIQIILDVPETLYG